MTGWQDLVTVALLGTDRRPVPDGLPASWAGPATDSSNDPTGAVLGYAVRHRAAMRAGALLPTGPAPDPAPVDHRAAMRAGALLPTGPAPDPAPVDHREPAPLDAQQRLADALATGGVSRVNEALTELVEHGGMAPELWATAAMVAAGSPRVDRTALAAALGVPGVWFVGRNPQWSRLAATLQARLAETSP